MFLFLPSFIKVCLKNLTEFNEVHVVLGNEACDLDSMVSSLVYAFSIFQVCLFMEANVKIKCSLYKEIKLGSKIFLFA